MGAVVESFADDPHVEPSCWDFSLSPTAAPLLRPISAPSTLRRSIRADLFCASRDRRCNLVVCVSAGFPRFSAAASATASRTPASAILGSAPIRDPINLSTPKSNAFPIGNSVYHLSTDGTSPPYSRTPPVILSPCRSQTRDASNTQLWSARYSRASSVCGPALGDPTFFLRVGPQGVPIAASVSVAGLSRLWHQQKYRRSLGPSALQPTFQPPRFPPSRQKRNSQGHINPR
jgi:hypothetical protein